MYKVFTPILVLMLSLASQAEAEDLNELEHRVAFYIDSALKVAKRHKDCDQRKSAVDTWVKDNPLKLKRIAQLTRALRKTHTDLSSDKLKAMREGSGVMGKAFSRLHAQSDDCKLSKVGVLVSLTTAMMTRAERRELSKNLKKIQLPKRKPLPKLVAMTPAFPEPMGLFAPLKIGMPLLKAQSVQPALETSGGMWSGAQPAIGGTFWLRHGCALNRDLLKQRGAFPWEWADTNVNAYVICVGEAKSESSRVHDKLDTVELGDFHIDLFDSKENHDRILKRLSELWGASAQASTQDMFSRKRNYHMWRDQLNDVCIILSAGHFVKRPEYLLNVRKCWRIGQLLGALLKAPGTPGAIIGATLKSLQQHYGRYSVWIDKDPKKAELKVPMYEVSPNRGDTIKLTLDQGRVTRADVSFSSKGVYTVDTQDHKLLTLSESITRNLKGQLKPKTLDAIKAGPQKREVKGIGIVNAWPDTPRIELKSGISLEIRAHPKMSELAIFLTEAP